MAKKNKKMAWGGKALDLETPQEAMARYNKNTIISDQKANEEAYPYDLLGNSLVNIGLSSATMGLGNVGGFGKVLGSNGNISKFGKSIDDLFGIKTGNPELKMGLGGVAGNIPLEAEGGEVMEVPGQEPVELQGPSHEGGGINMQVPPNTEFYSKRL